MVVKHLLDNNNKNVIFESVDRVKFTVPYGVACASEIVRAMGMHRLASIEFSSPDIKTSTLAKVIEYMDYHHTRPVEEIEKPLKSSNMKDVVSAWDADFVDIEICEIIDLCTAAYNLKIETLVGLTCAKLASMIRDMTVEQIRGIFGGVVDADPGMEPPHMSRE